MKTINISNYRPKSALNTLPIDLIDRLSYKLLPIERRVKRLYCGAIEPASLLQGK